MGWKEGGYMGGRVQGGVVGGQGSWRVREKGRAG